MKVLNAIAANKELVIKTCSEDMYQGEIAIDRVASIVVEALGFDVWEIAKVWADVEKIEALIKYIWENSLTGIWAIACEEMTEFIATLAPKQPEAIKVVTSHDNPLDRQLKALTGDGFNSIDWDLSEMGQKRETPVDSVLLKHRASGLVVKLMLKK